jgi:hypothetical protein
MKPFPKLAMKAALLVAVAGKHMCMTSNYWDMPRIDV